jgi:hypothetical protein
MRTHFPVLAPIAVAFLRIRRKLVVCVALCAIAVFFGWLAIRLSVTYLPPSDDQAVTGETVERPLGDLPRLQERVRRTAAAMLPSVVAGQNSI